MKINLSNLSFVTLLFLFSLLISANLLFLAGFSLNKVPFYFSLVICVFVLFFLKGNRFSNYFIILLFVIPCFFISVFYIDTSSDGQGYHLEMIIKFIEGWNPIYQFLPEENNIYIQHYPKGFELLSSSIIKVTNKIESGKIVNFLLFIICSFHTYNFFSKSNSKKISILFTLLLLFNPIVITEILTYYTDASIYFLTLSIIFLGFEIVEEDNIGRKRMIEFIALIVILLSIKYTAYIIVSIFCVIFFISILLKKDINKIITYLKIFLIIGCLFILTNVNPLITNLMNGFHIFHPVYGEQAITILGVHVTQEFNEYSRFYKLFLTTYSKTGYFKDMSIKYPFTVYLSELKVLYQATIVSGGFGPFFSGIFSIVLLYLIFSFKKIIKHIFIVTVLLGVVISLIFYKDPYPARIIIHFYIFLILSIYLIYKDKRLLSRYLSKVLIFFTILNTSLFIAITFFMLTYFSIYNHYVLNQLKEAKGIVNIQILAYPSNLYRFKENNIEYKLVKNDTDNFIMFKENNIKYSTRIYFDLRNNESFLYSNMDDIYNYVLNNSKK